MPTYEYVCAKCGEHLEVYQTFSEEPLKRHAGCGGKLQKVFSLGRDRPQGLRLLQDRQPRSSSRRSAERVRVLESSSDSSKTESKSDSLAPRSRTSSKPAAKLRQEGRHRKKSA